MRFRHPCHIQCSASVPCYSSLIKEPLSTFSEVHHPQGDHSDYNTILKLYKLAQTCFILIKSQSRSFFLAQIKLLVVLLKPLSLAAGRMWRALSLAEIGNGYLGPKYGSCAAIAAIFRKYNLADTRSSLFIVSETHVRHF